MHPANPPLLGTAAWHATRNVPIARPADPAGDVLTAMRGTAFDSAAVVAVCDGDHLAGLLTVERLLAADPARPVGELMDADPR